MKSLFFAAVSCSAFRMGKDQVDLSEMELGRYFNSRDEPIVLSQSKSHARLVLRKHVKNYE